MVFSSQQICTSVLVLVFLIIGLVSDVGFGHEGHQTHHHHSGSCESAVHENVNAHSHHQCEHGHVHHHTRHHHHHDEGDVSGVKKLPEELAEEEDLKLDGYGFHHSRDHGHEQAGSELSGVGNPKNEVYVSLFDSLRLSTSSLGSFGRALDSCNGLLTVGELGFPCLPDYFAFNIQ
ncbi:unnamed protein product [Ilex paraguariensis]|uniref:Uncharacterized protein n=1 Tax=Ilex paraguariensis TaxID=185542 RepID=A0ABC8TMP6_9AQUA